jgi:hypothetical protein
MSNSRLSTAAGRALLISLSDVRARTIVRWLLLAAIPIIPAMVELAGWPTWVDPPGLPSFHIIYWWSVLVLAFGAYEAYSNGRRRENWQSYWQDRGRILGGNMDEIGLAIIGARSGGGKPSSPDRIAAGILQQIADVATDLTRPEKGAHIMACMLVPVYEGTGAAKKLVALHATTYNQNAGRNKSRISVNDPSPACQAFITGHPQVVADTSAAPFGEHFKGRPYRSVMAYPVQIGGTAGHKLAVVTIDATVAGHFTEEGRIRDGIDAAIFPYLKLIGLVRIAEQKRGNRGTN